MPLALVTGATAGLGRALAIALDAAGYELVLTGRDPQRLDALRERLPGAAVLASDVTDSVDRAAVIAAVGARPLDLLVHNASDLGPSPLLALEQLEAPVLRSILEANVVGPAALTSALLPALRRGSGALVTVSSDAALEHYPTWGGYGASKAALDHLAGTWAAENPDLRVYAIDPGDMRTAMHQAAFPGEDISDRPLPDEVGAPGILAVLRAAPPSGRYRANDYLERSAA